MMRQLVLFLMIVTSAHKSGSCAIVVETVLSSG